ncbi:MAG: hypothetical protein KBT12_05335 [Bacteroidales bacterium]|nr:hypothetical protein [Candidatus Physcousia equi]
MRTITIVCTVIFVAFSLAYLILFQADVMTMAQHKLSQGRTTYHVHIFSFLITAALTVVAYACNHYVKLPLRARALAFFPSFWGLGLLSNVNLSSLSPSAHNVGALPFLFVLLFWIGTTILLRQIHQPKFDNTPLSQALWPNLMIIALGINFTCLMGNTQQNIHYELRMERLAMEEDYDRVLQIGAENPQTSRCIMVLRAYALSRQGTLGDRLFTYPNNLSSDALLPIASDSIRPANLPAVMKEYLGGFPTHDMKATRYLQLLTSDTLAKEPAHDYLLCAFLLDRNLDAFADSLLSFYPPTDSIVKKEGRITTYLPQYASLPRHYAEALLLYSRLREQPVCVLLNDEILENYLNFSQLYHAGDAQHTEADCQSYYGNTYWNYYFFK